MRKLSFDFLFEVVNMHRFSVNNSSAYGRAITESPGLGHRHRPILRHGRKKNIPIDASDQAIGSVTKPRGTLNVSARDIGTHDVN